MSFTAEKLHALADQLEAKINDPQNNDDPKWLQRRVNRLRQLATKKEKAFVHKQGGKR